LEHTEREMSAFGEGLRRERETRGISLEEISATIKIGTRLLGALEDEQFELLPGGIFNKGYVRAYAKYVGIDEEKAIAAYLQAAHEAGLGARAVADQDDASRLGGSSREVDGFESRSPFPVVAVLIGLILLAAIAGGWRIYRDRRQQAAKAVASDAKMSGASVTNHAPTDGFASAKPATQLPATVPMRVATAKSAVANPAGDTSFELTVRPTGRAWVSIKSDGKFAVRGIIKPPEVKTIRANNQVVFWTGNAGAVEVTFNGKNVPLTGGENEERVLVFNSRGLLPQSAAQ
jgi:cytoskeleton protein RodZ